MNFAHVCTAIRPTTRALAAAASLAIATASFGQNTCNPQLSISLSPAASQYAPGQEITITVTFGTGAISGGSAGSISNLNVLLDCATAGNLCANGCSDATNPFISYNGDSSIIHDTSCGGVHAVASNNPGGGTGVNPLNFHFTPAISLPPNSTCQLSFKVTVQDMGALNSKTIRGRATIEGLCNNGLDLFGCSTYSYQIVKPQINLVKDVSAANICADQTVTYTYTVTNTGGVALAVDKATGIVDDNGTPGDPSDDFHPTYVSGDTNSNNLLDLNETWIFTYGPVTPPVGTTTNTAVVTGTFTNAVSTITVMDDDDATTTVHALPIVQVFGEKICNSEGTGQVCAVVTGGRPPFTVCWYQNGALIPDSCQVVSVQGGQACLPVTDRGVYCAVATDSNGCVSGDTDEACGSIDINPNPLVTVTNDTVCVGSCGELHATVGGGTPPYTVQWYNASNDPVGSPCTNVPENGQCNLNVCDGNTYTARVVDSKKCDGEASGNLHFHPVPSCYVNSSAAKICPGQTATLCAVVTGGTPPYTYLWNTGATTQCLIDIGTPGLYTVDVLDHNGCPTQCSFDLLPNVVDVEIVCTPAGPGQLQLCANVISGRPPMTFRWSTGGQTQCITITPGPSPCLTYLVTATDANHCSVTEIYELAEGPGGTCVCPTQGGSNCPADITHDGAVNVSDLLAIINAWGPCPAPPAGCIADISPQPNADGAVNVSDLLAVINGWGPCP